jgi:very-short-patch-repair endonuclease
VTSIERTLVDIGRHWGPKPVGSLLDDAVMRRFTTYGRFALRVDELSARGRPGIRTARAVLADRDLAGGSPFEQQMDRLLRSAGLPTPVREFRVMVNGRNYFVDFAYPEALLGIECDSSTWHTKPQHFEYDLRRQNDIVRTGMLLLRYTTKSIRTDAHRITRDVEHHLRARHPAFRSPIP